MGYTQVPLSGEEFQGDNDLPCPVAERGQADKDAKAAMVLDNWGPHDTKKKASLLAQWSEVRLQQVGNERKGKPGSKECRDYLAQKLGWEKEKKKQSWWYQFSREVGQLLKGKGLKGGEGDKGWGQLG